MSPSAGPRVLHLNGPPGVGKSTLARRYAAEHPGTLCLDVDVLRTWVGGWEQDFAAAGEAVRETALAMLTAWVRTGHDVVLPQLLGDPGELARFRAAAEAGGAVFLSVMLWADLPEAVRRFGARPRDEPVARVVGELVDRAGGEPLARHHAALEGMRTSYDAGLVVVAAADRPEQTYADLLAALSGR